MTHGEEPLELRKAQNWVSEAAVREASKNLRHWPSRLRWIFDKSSKDASKAIIITTYEYLIESDDVEGIDRWAE